MECLLCHDEIDVNECYINIFRVEPTVMDSKHAIHIKHFAAIPAVDQAEGTVASIFVPVGDLLPKPIVVEGKITCTMTQDYSLAKCTCGWSSESNGYVIGVFDDACAHERDTGHRRIR